MKNRDLEHIRLNEFEKKLLEAAALPENEIEKIVGNQQLFNSIAARIEVQKSIRKRENVFAGCQFFLGYNRRVIGFSFAFLLLILLAATGLILRRTENFGQNSAVSKTVGKTAATDFSVLMSPTKVLPTPVNNSGQSVEQATYKAKVQKPGGRKIVKKENVKLRMPPEKPNAESLPETAAAPEKTFYSLVVPGAAEIGNGERRIVRAELSRPALFALGVNVVAGNDDNQKFKTDLVVGADGVPQAIRFVE